MKRSETLLKNLKENVIRIDSVLDRIDNLKNKSRYTDDDINEMEALYRNEFMLYMDNSSIYDDLMEEIEAEDPFTRRRIAQEADKLLRVEQVDMGGK